MEVEMKSLEKPVLRIRIPSVRIEDVEEQFDEADPEWRDKLEFNSVLWNWAVIVRVPERIYDILASNEDYLECAKNEIIRSFIWKNEVRFEVF